MYAENIATNGVNGNVSQADRIALGWRISNPLANKLLYVATCTWNVRTMTPLASMEQITKEAERLRIDVLGISETH